MILMSKPLLVEQAGKSTVENTLVVMVLSLAMVRTRFAKVFKPD